MDGVLTEILRLCLDECKPGQFSYIGLIEDLYPEKVSITESLTCCGEDLCNFSTGGTPATNKSAYLISLITFLIVLFGLIYD
jgi:hypothetical protein